MSHTIPPGASAPPQASADPSEPVFAWYQQMLATEPVRRDEQGVWHVFRHADVMRVLGDPATFSSDTRVVLPEPEREDLMLFARGNIVNMDPPSRGSARSPRRCWTPSTTRVTARRRSTWSTRWPTRCR